MTMPREESKKNVMMPAQQQDHQLRQCQARPSSNPSFKLDFVKLNQNQPSKRQPTSQSIQTNNRADSTSHRHSRSYTKIIAGNTGSQATDKDLEKDSKSGNSHKRRCMTQDFQQVNLKTIKGTTFDPQASFNVMSFRKINPKFKIYSQGGSSFAEPLPKQHTNGEANNMGFGDTKASAASRKSDIIEESCRERSAHRTSQQRELNPKLNQ